MRADRTRTLSTSIKACEEFADHFADLSAIARDRGNRELSNAFAAHGRMHRVRTIQLKAMLSARVGVSGLPHRELGSS